MDNVAPPNHSPILSLICTAFGHDYDVTQKSINQYQCSCCGKQAASIEQLFENT